jgi:hypothetical protein
MIHWLTRRLLAARAFIAATATAVVSVVLGAFPAQAASSNLSAAAPTLFCRLRRAAWPRAHAEQGGNLSFGGEAVAKYRIGHGLAIAARDQLTRPSPFSCIGPGMFPAAILADISLPTNRKGWHVVRPPEWRAR